MKYKILETNAFSAANPTGEKDPERQWVRILLDFEDGVTREKRMHADARGLLRIDAAIRRWWQDYGPLYAAEKVNATAQAPAVASAISAGTVFPVT